MRRHLSVCLMTIIALGALLAAAPAQAAPRTRCFAETNQCVSGSILEYWERNGGLPVFGYPISQLQTETNDDGWTGPIQWFQRDRLEDHGPGGVMAGRLGAQFLGYRGTLWNQYDRVSSAPPECRFFPETGHSLCGAFMDYWYANGGLERFGYPITEQMHEDLPMWSGTVQYFERRRMELHPENAGTPYEVLLGLLGRELHDPSGCKEIVAALQATAAAYPNVFGCGAPFPQINVPIAVEQFERGQMIWIQYADKRGGWLWVTFYDNTRNTIAWELYPDNWHEGDAVSGGETPPAGLYEPARGFGKLWRENQHVRSVLGWALAPEVGDRGSMQYFQGGSWMLHRQSSDRVLLVFPDNHAEEITRIK